MPIAAVLAVVAVIQTASGAKSRSVSSSKSCKRVETRSYCKKYVVLTPLETVAYCYFDMKRFNEAIMSFRFHIGSPHLNHMLVGQ